MKSFFERLALLIHWIGFAVVVGGVAFGLFYLADIDRMRVYWIAVVACGGFSWALKWLISGNKSLWPWKSSE